MKQDVSPKVVIGAIAVVVLLVAAGAAWVWRAPSAVAAKPFSRAEMDKAMRESHQGPTPEQMQKIQEWKKAHPGASTRF